MVYLRVIHLLYTDESIPSGIEIKIIRRSIEWQDSFHCALVRAEHEQIEMVNEQSKSSSYISTIRSNYGKIKMRLKFLYPLVQKQYIIFDWLVCTELSSYIISIFYRSGV